ncbi:MAG: hypothetical protein CMO20_05945 [Thermoplasmata archaeon]|nr:hypothetical protein [Thermoplasmata archaeon]|tara:strand:+ start:6724 stop:7563 length:840 start_codon:yes stop_codon:yes gene_type:complete
MRTLLELEAFAPIADNLRSVNNQLSNSETITILIPPTPTGAVASAFLEAAMLDTNIPYRRRISPREISHPSIVISDGITTDSPKEFSSDPIKLNLSPFFTIGLRDIEGNPSRSILSPVAQAAALAELIAPDGLRTRKLRPWVLAGNWWGETLNQGQDSVYHSLRNHLREEGTIRVVTILEVDTDAINELKNIDSERFASTREVWSSLDADGKAKAISTLVLPELISDKMPMPRIEELVWHRIIVKGSEEDFHSSMSKIKGKWDGSPDSTSELIEKLITN